MKKMVFLVFLVLFFPFLKNLNSQIQENKNINENIQIHGYVEGVIHEPNNQSQYFKNNLAIEKYKSEIKEIKERLIAKRKKLFDHFIQNAKESRFLTPPLESFLIELYKNLLTNNTSETIIINKPQSTEAQLKDPQDKEINKTSPLDNWISKIQLTSDTVKKINVNEFNFFLSYFMKDFDVNNTNFIDIAYSKRVNTNTFRILEELMKYNEFLIFDGHFDFMVKDFKNIHKSVRCTRNSDYQKSRYCLNKDANEGEDKDKDKDKGEKIYNPEVEDGYSITQKIGETVIKAGNKFLSAYKNISTEDPEEKEKRYINLFSQMYMYIKDFSKEEIENLFNNFKALKLFIIYNDEIELLNVLKKYIDTNSKIEEEYVSDVKSYKYMKSIIPTLIEKGTVQDLKLVIDKILNLWDKLRKDFFKSTENLEYVVTLEPEEKANLIAQCSSAKNATKKGCIQHKKFVEQLYDSANKICLVDSSVDGCKATADVIRKQKECLEEDDPYNVSEECYTNPKIRKNQAIVVRLKNKCLEAPSSSRWLGGQGSYDKRPEICYTTDGVKEEMINKLTEECTQKVGTTKYQDIDINSKCKSINQVKKGVLEIECQKDDFSDKPGECYTDSNLLAITLPKLEKYCLNDRQKAYDKIEECYTVVVSPNIQNQMLEKLKQDCNEHRQSSWFWSSDKDQCKRRVPVS